MTNKEKLLIALALIPIPLALMGRIEHVELASGFTITLTLHAMRRAVWITLMDIFKNPEVVFNIWLGMLLCQAAFTTKASLNVYDSIQPGIALTLAGIIVSYLLASPAEIPSKPTKGQGA